MIRRFFFTLLLLPLVIEANCQPYRNKISFGAGIGYKSELSGGGLLMEWEAFKNVKLMAGAGFSNKIPAGYSLGTKVIIKDFVLLKKTAERSNDIYLSPAVGLNYFKIPHDVLSYSVDGIISYYQFPTSEYIIPSIGIAYRGSDPSYQERLLGGDIYLILYYTHRIEKENIVLLEGPRQADYERKINNRSGGGLGIALSFAFHIRIFKNTLTHTE